MRKLIIFAALLIFSASSQAQSLDLLTVGSPYPGGPTRYQADFEDVSDAPPDYVVVMPSPYESFTLDSFEGESESRTTFGATPPTQGSAGIAGVYIFRDLNNNPGDFWISAELLPGACGPIMTLNGILTVTAADPEGNVKVIYTMPIGGAFFPPKSPWEYTSRKFHLPSGYIVSTQFIAWGVCTAGFYFGADGDITSIP